MRHLDRWIDPALLERTRAAIAGIIAPHQAHRGDVGPAAARLAAGSAAIDERAEYPSERRVLVLYRDVDLEQPHGDLVARVRRLGKAVVDVLVDIDVPARSALEIRHFDIVCG